MVSLLNRKTAPLFTLNVSPKFQNQLRYAVRLYSEDLEGVILLVDAFKWIEVCFTGVSKMCPVLCDVIHEAILSCVEPLAYDSLALDYDLALLCRHPSHKVEDVSPHPAIVKLTRTYATCTISKECQFDLDTNRELHWFTQKDTKTGMYEQHLAKYMYVYI